MATERSEAQVSPPPRAVTLSATPPPRARARLVMRMKAVQVDVTVRRRTDWSQVRGLDRARVVTARCSVGMMMSGWFGLGSIPALSRFVGVGG